MVLIGVVRDLDGFIVGGGGSGVMRNWLGMLLVVGEQRSKGLLFLDGLKLTSG